MRHRIALAAVLGLVLAALAAGFTLGRYSHGAGPAATGPAPEADQVFTCSMHPQIRLPRPGNCPICEMPLIPAQSAASGAGGPPALQLSEHALAMAHVETVPVVRRELARPLRAVGKVQYSEWSLATITARVDGYAERLFVNFTGMDLKAGDHLAEIYSPELVLAQEELLIALQSGATEPTAPLVQAARLKLERWGLTPAQTRALVENRKITDRVTLYSPIRGTVIEKAIVQNSAFKAGDALYRVADLDTVWVYLDIYEYDLALVRYGQRVTLTAEALPGREFIGMVTFLEPVVNEQTRTLRVPVHVENPDHALKPGMFVSAVIHAQLGGDGQAAPTGIEGRFSCPMHPQVLADHAGACPLCEMPLERIPGATEPGAHFGHQVPATAPAPRYLCPMKCEGEKFYDQPGHCPVCHMKLKAVDAAPPSPATMPATAPAPRYLCPMKCEGEKSYDQSGRCPVCHMKLKAVDAAPPPPAGKVGPLVVPLTAVLDSGTRQLVYVEKSRGLFEPREVVLGARAGEWVPVLKGLAEGERVVTRGGFLIDSQFQITGHPSLFYPGGLMGPPADGGHDGHAAPAASAAAPLAPAGDAPRHQH